MDPAEGVDNVNKTSIDTNVGFEEVPLFPINNDAEPIELQLKVESTEDIACKSENESQREGTNLILLLSASQNVSSSANDGFEVEKVGSNDGFDDHSCIGVQEVNQDQKAQFIANDNYCHVSDEAVTYENTTTKNSDAVSVYM